MNPLASIFRFVRPDGLHYCYELRQRGQWKKRWAFAESQELADKKIVALCGYQHVCSVIRRADTKQIIWELMAKAA